VWLEDHTGSVCELAGCTHGLLHVTAHLPMQQPPQQSMLLDICGLAGVSQCKESSPPSLTGELSVNSIMFPEMFYIHVLSMYLLMEKTCWSCQALHIYSRK
jgi:hypothetical protein